MIFVYVKTIALLAAILVINGCAGSASHRVVTANQAGDNAMNCEAIEAGIVETQVIIDGVNEDKDDISGADIIDGILWFPFNLIAKNENYNDALDAAEKRIERLNKLKKANNCNSSNDEIQQRADDTLNKLKDLSRRHKEGEFTDDEYKKAKQKLLEDL